MFIIDKLAVWFYEEERRHEVAKPILKSTLFPYNIG